MDVMEIAELHHLVCVQNVLDFVRHNKFVLIRSFYAQNEGKYASVWLEKEETAEKKSISLFEMRNDVAEI